MSFTDIKTKSQGFTIVELLIVVVVIAILAAITIVSYNGITNRANASAAQSTAASLQKKAELFASDGPTNAYPAKLSDLTGAAVVQNATSVTTSSANTWYVAPNSINVTTDPATAPDSVNGKTTVQYTPCGTGGSGSAAAITNVTGAKIIWYDFVAKSTKTITVGTTATGCATAA